MKSSWGVLDVHDNTKGCMSLGKLSMFVCVYVCRVYEGEVKIDG